MILTESLSLVNEVANVFIYLNLVSLSRETAATENISKMMSGWLRI